MQIFASSSDYTLAAQYLDDKRVNKMITESAQIICTVLAQDGVPNLKYKPTHQNHPAVRWAGARDDNLSWLMKHHIALNLEWEYRFNKTHGAGLTPWEVGNVRHTGSTPKKFHNGASNALRELDFTWCDNVHDAYKLYLTARWLNDSVKPKWTKRLEPKWYGAGYLYQLPDLGMLLINHTKDLIRHKQLIKNCPRCGSPNFKVESINSFTCTERNIWPSCLSWKELKTS